MGPPGPLSQYPQMQMQQHRMQQQQMQAMKRKLPGEAVGGAVPPVVPGASESAMKKPKLSADGASYGGSYGADPGPNLVPNLGPGLSMGEYAFPSAYPNASASSSFLSSFSGGGGGGAGDGGSGDASGLSLTEQMDRVVKLLRRRARQEGVTPQDILDATALDLNSSVDLALSLRQNPRVAYDAQRNVYRYLPPLLSRSGTAIASRLELLQTLSARGADVTDMATAFGVSKADLLDTYDGAPRDLAALVRSSGLQPHAGAEIAEMPVGVIRVWNRSREGSGSTGNRDRFYPRSDLVVHAESGDMRERTDFSEFMLLPGHLHLIKGSALAISTADLTGELFRNDLLVVEGPRAAPLPGQPPPKPRLHSFRVSSASVDIGEDRQRLLGPAVQRVPLPAPSFHAAGGFMAPHLMAPHLMAAAAAAGGGAMGSLAAATAGGAAAAAGMMNAQQHQMLLQQYQQQLLLQQYQQLYQQQQQLAEAAAADGNKPVDGTEATAATTAAEATASTATAAAPPTTDQKEEPVEAEVKSEGAQAGKTDDAEAKKERGEEEADGAVEAAEEEEEEEEVEAAFVFPEGKDEDDDDVDVGTNRARMDHEYSGKRGSDLRMAGVAKASRGNDVENTGGQFSVSDTAPHRLYERDGAAYLLPFTATLVPLDRPWDGPTCVNAKAWRYGAGADVRGLWRLMTMRREEEFAPLVYEPKGCDVKIKVAPHGRGKAAVAAAAADIKAAVDRCQRIGNQFPLFVVEVPPGAPDLPTEQVNAEGVGRRSLVARLGEGRSLSAVLERLPFPQDHAALREKMQAVGLKGNAKKEGTLKLAISSSGVVDAAKVRSSLGLRKMNKRALNRKSNLHLSEKDSAAVNRAHIEILRNKAATREREQQEQSEDMRRRQAEEMRKLRAHQEQIAMRARGLDR
jgi:hypothetical protein